MLPSPEPAALKSSTHRLVNFNRFKLLPASLLLAATFTACGPAANGPGDGGVQATPAGPQWDLDWARGAAFYEVFVRSFADSNGDGIGDLQGLIAHLDYLNDGDPETSSDLGVEGLWLMPIFPSPSYHGYDATDYESVNPDYGTEEDLQQLLAEAHRRGMRVILDLMINHTSAQHPWFVEASDPAAARRDWYVWRNENPGWTQPWGDHTGATWHRQGSSWYYGLFSPRMPDLNFRNPAVKAEVIRLANLWLERGVDGFRLDAARHLIADGAGALQNDTPETHAAWREIAAAVRARHPQALLLGECWSSTPIIATYYGSTTQVAAGDELPMTFNFPVSEAILTSLWDGDPRPLATTLAAVQRYYPSGVLDGTFVTNHDMVRLSTQVGNDRNRRRSAAALLLTLPGTPFLYYGEEIGMPNGDLQEGDPAKRTPMAWNGTANGGFTTGRPWHPLAAAPAGTNVASQLGDSDSLLSHYRRLIHLRHDYRALRQGSLTLLTDPGKVASMLVFLRESGDEHLLVAHNLTTEVGHAGPFDLPGNTPAVIFTSLDGLPPEAAGASAISVTGQPGAWTFHLPPGVSAVWRLS